MQAALGVDTTQWLKLSYPLACEYLRSDAAKQLWPAWIQNTAPVVPVVYPVYEIPQGYTIGVTVANSLFVSISIAIPSLL